MTRTIRNLASAVRLAAGIRPRDRSDREPHQPTETCSPHHCYSHNLDEPLNPRNKRATVCGECFHYYPTPLHLWITYQWGALPIYRAELHERRTRTTTQNIDTPTWPAVTLATLELDGTGRPTTGTRITPPPPPKPVTYGRIALMVVKHLTTRPRNIHFCPHCLHDL